MDDTGRDHAIRKRAGNGLREALEAIDRGNQDVADTASLELVHDPQPELRALRLLDPHAQDRFCAADGEVYGLVAAQSLVADRHPERVEVDDRVGRFQRPVLPRGNLVDDAVRHRRDQVRRYLDAVELAHVGLDVSSAHSPGVQGDSLLVKTGKTPLEIPYRPQLGRPRILFLFFFEVKHTDTNESSRFR